MGGENYMTNMVNEVFNSNVVIACFSYFIHPCKIVVEVSAGRSILLNRAQKSFR